MTEKLTGERLIERWAGWIRGFVYCTPEQSVLLALWCMHTWVYEQFAATPYLSIVGLTMRAGKTTTLKVAKLLCRGAEEEATLRVISMARKVEALEGKVTIMWDEVEKLGSSALNETRKIIAAGYQRGAQHSVTLPGKTEVMENGVAVTLPARIERFRVYCPKLFASIGDIQPVLRDRSILFDLLRGKPARSFTLERDQAEAEAAELVREFIEWFKAQGFRKLPVTDPDWLESSRDREIWTPIFSLAGALGLNEKIVGGLVAMSVDVGLIKDGPQRTATQDDEVNAVEIGMADRVLREAVSVFKGTETRLPSEVIVERLRGIQTAPWRGWRGGLTVISLSSLLSRYGIKPATMRIGKGQASKVANGYKLDELQAALKK